MKLKRIGALALSLALTLSLSAPALGAETAPPTPHPAELAAQYGGATAVQYALWQDGKITASGHSGVYSKTENRALLETDLFGIGSISKVYTTAAMMKLVEAGKVDLDSPVTKYLPTFKMADERYKAITVRMLLNHSSGLMGGSTNDAFLFADTDQTATSDLLNRLSTQGLKAKPGEIAVYCNDGFTLAELVIEAVSGKTFFAYLRENILKPAGLENTFVPQDDFDTSRLVKTYATADETRPLPQDTLGIVGCGGLYATASDLAAFGGALTDTKVLSQKSLTAMAHAEYKNGIWPEDDADLLAYGLGWDSVKAYPFALDGVQALTKGGDTQFYHAALVVVPAHKMAVAVLSSGGVSTYNQLAANQMLIAALKDKGVAITETAPTLPAAAPADMPAALADHSGYYGAFSQQMKVTVADNTLTIHSLTVPTAPNQVFTYCSDGTFRDESGTTVVKPVVEDNGITYLYQKAWGAVPGLGLMPVSNYLAQKLPENIITAEIQSAWEKLLTTGTPINMKYTSQLYVTLFTQIAAMAGITPEYVPGYLGATRIIDKTTARNELSIPGTGSRDSNNFIAYEEDGQTYLSTNQGIIYGDATQVSHGIYTDGDAYCTVSESGYARWYEVGEKAVGKTMTVTVPENAGFYVYAANGAVVASSVVYGDTAVVLPQDGAIAFAGDPGSRFHLAFTNP